MSVYQPFQKAVPVWPVGRETEMNITCRFTAQIPKTACLLRMTGSTVYRVFVNGNMIAYGPARGPKGYFRVDELDITDALKKEENLVLFEVAGYNVNSFYTLDQPSFFQAELLSGDEILAYTAAEGGMPCDMVTERVQKVQKFSYQRPFAESWRLGKAYADAFSKMTRGDVVLAVCGEKSYLPRRVPFPLYTDLPATELVGAGAVRLSKEPFYRFRDRSLTKISPLLKGYSMDELEVTLTEDAGYYDFVCDPVKRRELLPGEALSLTENRFVTVKFDSNLTGFPAMTVHAASSVTLILQFDELFEGDIDVNRMGTVNEVRYDLKPGDYNLLAMEPYTMQYLKITAFGGEVTLSRIRLVEYAAPDTGFQMYRSDNEKLQKIWDAAVQTYRQNALDLYMDCPSRERAGWLCDSFWTARTEYALTGKSVVEKNFLENFLLPASFEGLPEGMLPMCYPSDHYNGEHIPNWAMWLVMELREYLQRSGDREMVDAFRSKIYGLFAYLDKYLNTDGLLEKLPGWVFVEWSKANELVQDVNFPTNMLYAACLEAAGELYGDAALTLRAEKMRETIRRLSFNGVFFTDHLIREENGLLSNPGESTEVCQYYAFYLGVATPETYPALWKTLLEDFGPYRRENNKHPSVYFANAFIGNYLRLDMMAKTGLLDEVLENIEGYFYKMAVTTGTLWENDTAVASLDHGFASHVVVWLLQAEKRK